MSLSEEPNIKLNNSLEAPSKDLWVNSFTGQMRSWETMTFPSQPRRGTLSLRSHCLDFYLFLSKQTPQSCQKQLSVVSEWCMGSWIWLIASLKWQVLGHVRDFSYIAWVKWSGVLKGIFILNKYFLNICITWQTNGMGEKRDGRREKWLWFTN